MSSTAARAGELRVLVVVHEKESGEDGVVQQLTAITYSQTARSGMSRCGGDVERDLRPCSVKMRSKKTLQSV